MPNKKIIFMLALVPIIISALLLIVIKILLTPRHSRVDLWIDSPCDAPCWHGIIPGVTTESDLQAFAASLPYMDDPNVETYWHNGWRNFSEIFEVSFEGGSRDNARLDIGLVDGIVSDIVISGENSFIELNHRLSEVISKYGTPTSFFPAGGCGGDIGCNTLNFTYPEKGILVQTNTDVVEVIEVRKDMMIMSLMYLDSGHYHDYLIQYYPWLLNQCIYEDYYYQWQGYGTIELPSSWRRCFK
jgi:hypothetical protein